MYHKTIFSKSTGGFLDKEARREQLRKEGRIPGGRDSKKTLEELGLTALGSWPKHEPAFHVIQETFPEFSWEEHRTAKTVGRALRFSGYPNVGGQNPSLADLVIEARRGPMDPPRLKLDLFSPNIKRRVNPLLDVGGEELARVLVDLPIFFPPMVIMDAVANWWEGLASGEVSTIFTAVSPAYATRETDDPSLPEVYTFDGLGTGIGLVGRRALPAVLNLWEFFKSKGIRNIRFVVAIGDDEADNPENLRRVGLDREEFVTRLRESQEFFSACCPTDMPLETPLLTEINSKLWYELMKEARNAVDRREYGALGLAEADLEIICNARRPLYERWYGENCNARSVLDRQAPEYMAFGALAEACFPNVLCLGADSVAMAPFVQGLTNKVRPVINLRAPNY